MNNLVVEPKKKQFLVPFMIVLFAIITLVAVFLIVAMFSTSSDITEEQVETVVFDIRDSVVGVECDVANTPVDNTRMYGTAFAITNRDFLTNRHVVIESINYPIRIYHPKWENSDNSLIARSVTIKAISEEYDLAWIQLEFEDQNIKPLTISTNEAVQGEEVFTLGYPAYALQRSKTGIPEITFDKGFIKAVNRVIAGNDCYEMSATINGGNSGGPLFNSNNHVIGVNTFGLDELENCFFAIKIETVKKAFPELWEKAQKESY